MEQIFIFEVATPSAHLCKVLKDGLELLVVGVIQEQLAHLALLLLIEGQVAGELDQVWLGAIHSVLDATGLHPSKARQTCSMYFRQDTDECAELRTKPLLSPAVSSAPRFPHIHTTERSFARGRLGGVHILRAVSAALGMSPPGPVAMPSTCAVDLPIEGKSVKGESPCSPHLCPCSPRAALPSLVCLRGDFVAAGGGFCCGSHCRCRRRHQAPPTPLADKLPELVPFNLAPTPPYLCTALTLLSLKRTYDLFSGNHAQKVPLDEEAQKAKLACKVGPWSWGWAGGGMGGGRVGGWPLPQASRIALLVAWSIEQTLALCRIDA